MAHARLLLLMTVLLSAPLAAQPASSDDASREYNMGQTAQAQSNWELALLHYQRSYKLVPHYATAYNIGVCYEHLGQARQAAAFFQTYLDKQPDAADKPEVEQRIFLLRQRHSNVRFLPDGPGGTIEIDGKIRLNLPGSAELPAGAHRVRVLSIDATPTTFELAYGEPQAVHIKTTSKSLSLGLTLGGGTVKHGSGRVLTEVSLALRGALAHTSAYAWEIAGRVSSIEQADQYFITDLVEHAPVTQTFLSLGLGTYRRAGWQHHAAVAVGYANQPTWLVEVRAGLGYGWHRYLLWTIGLETGFAAALYRNYDVTPAAQFPLVLQLGVAN